MTQVRFWAVRRPVVDARGRERREDALRPRIAKQPEIGSGGPYLRALRRKVEAPMSDCPTGASMRVERIIGDGPFRCIGSDVTSPG